MQILIIAVGSVVMFLVGIGGLVLSLQILLHQLRSIFPITVFWATLDLGLFLGSLVLTGFSLVSFIYRKQYPTRLSNLHLLFLSTVICGPVVLEIGFRAGIVLHPKFQHPGLYADYYSDDNYWKLYHLWNPDYYPPSPERVHPVLGWVNVPQAPENPLGIIHETPYSPDYGPGTVLFFGDSFVVGATPIPEKIPQIVDRLLPERTVYNYGGSGYGVDQIYLRFRMTYSQFHQPIILIGIFSDDLDRCVLSVRTGQKPYFTLQNETLTLAGLPIYANQREWLQQHPPTIASFFLAFLTHRLRIWKANGHYYELFYKREAKKRICAGILETLVQEARQHNLPLMFVFFYGQRELRYTGWREQFLVEQATKWDVPYIDTKRVLLHASEQHHLPLAELFIQGDGHPTARANQLIAEAIGKRLRAFRQE